MELSQVITLITIIVYLCGMVAIGFRISKRNKSADDFYLGGRKLGPLVTATSAEASDMSSYLLLGLPGLAFVLGNGFAEVVWTTVGLAVGTYLNWLLVARRIRKYTEKTKSVTLPDFFSDRFGDKKGFLTAISAVIIIVFFVPYTASGFSAIGKLFNSLFGADYRVAMLVGAAVIAVYTVLGGFLAASVTDLIQSVIMTFALIVIVIFSMNNAGGMSEIVRNAFEKTPDAFSLVGENGEFGFLSIVSTLAWGLGYFGMPHILLRFMAIENDKKLALSRRVASVWVVISMAIAVFIGVAGYTFAVNHGLLANTGFDSERIIIYIADALAENGVVFAVIAGVVLSGILAATMSTADSQMLAAASSASENIVHRFFFPNMSEKARMWVARGTVILISVIGALFALNENSSVFKVVSFAWAGFGAAFGPLVLFALFWKRTNKWGALAGLIGGGATVFVWKFLVAPLGGAFAIYELLPAFLLSAILIVSVSLLTGKPEQEIMDTFDAVSAEMKVHG